MTRASKEDMALNQIFDIIYYPIWFKKDKVRALINLSSKVNTMILRYALELGLKVCHTNVKARKIDDSILKMFKMVLASFQVKNKFRRACFFQKIFLLADISVKMGLEMFFLTLSNMDI